MTERAGRRDVVTLVGAPGDRCAHRGTTARRAGPLWTLLQPTAALVVFGGTLAAIVSYPLRPIGATARAVLLAVEEVPEPDSSLVIRLAEFGAVARRKD